VKWPQRRGMIFASLRQRYGHLAMTTHITVRTILRSTIPGLLLVAMTLSEQVMAQAVIRIMEARLWTIVTSVVMPEFPVEARAHRTQGVCVVEIFISPAGKVTRSKVLQAPSDQVGQAAEKALRRWTFPSERDDTRERVGKITFYFTFEHGDAVVRSPYSATFVGPDGRGVVSFQRPK
jgi:TonB family protein